MTRYRVSFFKNLLGFTVIRLRCLQQAIVIRRAKSVERAVEAAKRRFECRCHVADWRCYADGVESGDRYIIVPPAVKSQAPKGVDRVYDKVAVKSRSVNRDYRSWPRPASLAGGPFAYRRAFDGHARRRTYKSTLAGPLRRLLRVSLIHRMKTCVPLLKERPIRRVHLAGSPKKREQSVGELEFAFKPSNAQSSMGSWRRL